MSVTSSPSPYARRKSRLPSAPASAPVDADSYVDPSPITGHPIIWKKRVIDSEKIDEVLVKNKFNLRSHRHVTRAAVNDILPDIAEQKRNSNYCRGLISGDKVELLEGVRRSASVSFVPGAKLYLWVADSLTEDEQRHFSQSSDVYRQPTQLDIGYSALEIRSEYESRGEKIRDFQLAELFGVSAGRMSESIKSASLPDELIGLFPALEFIGPRWLRTVIQWQKKIGNGGIVEAIEHLSPVSSELVENDEIETASAALQSDITRCLQATETKSVKSSDAIDKWRAMPASKSLGLKVNSKGVVQLSFSPDKLDDDLQQKLLSLYEAASK